MIVKSGLVSNVITKLNMIRPIENSDRVGVFNIDYTFSEIDEVEQFLKTIYDQMGKNCHSWSYNLYTADDNILLSIFITSIDDALMLKLIIGA